MLSVAFHTREGYNCVELDFNLNRRVLFVNLSTALWYSNN